MIAHKDFNRAVRGQLQSLMPPKTQPAFSLRPKTPTPPFLWVAESELQYIRERGGGGYEISAWVGVVSKANSRRSSEFRSRIRDLATLMGCRYRKAGPLLDWLENIGLLQISRSTDANGSRYRLGTICLSKADTPRQVVPNPSAQSAQVASARHADSIQERGPIKTLQEGPQAAAPPCVPQAHAPRQPPTEVEPTAEQITQAEEHFARWGIGVCVRFTATNNPKASVTDVLNTAIHVVPESKLRHICAFVCAKGNAQRPPWEPSQRAAVLTARLKEIPSTKTQSQRGLSNAAA